MNHLCFFALTAVTFELGWAQVRYSWLPEDLPNPQRKPKACGLGPNPGYICDPNGILTRHQLDTLDWFLRGLADTDNPDHCPCSRYHCEHSAPPRFYKLAIALIPKLQLPRNASGVAPDILSQAQNFAYHLEHDLWNISSCQEDIVILYSRDDRALVTMTGRTAGRKLDAYSRGILHSIVGQHFADGRINEGLLRMVHEIKLVLNANNYYRDMDQIGSTGYRASASTLLFLILAIGSILLARITNDS